jgi:hypothetical protein
VIIRTKLYILAIWPYRATLDYLSICFKSEALFFTKMSGPFENSVLDSLRSNGEGGLLDAIDTLRSQGIGHYVSLPQLIVCGDQSSGKSSVLEAISGIPFPTRDNMCTWFATEVRFGDLKRTICALVWCACSVIGR